MVLRSFDACCELYNFVLILFFFGNVHTVVILCDILSCVSFGLQMCVLLRQYGWQAAISNSFVYFSINHFSKDAQRKSGLELPFRSDPKGITFFIDEDDDETWKNGKLMKWLMELFSNMKIELIPMLPSREKKYIRVASWLISILLTIWIFGTILRTTRGTHIYYGSSKKSAYKLTRKQNPVKKFIGFSLKCRVRYSRYAFRWSQGYEYENFPTAISFTHLH